MPVKFSVIINSRGRYQSLIASVDSVFKTAKNIDDVELFIMADSDDTTTHDTVKQIMRDNPNWNINFHIQDRKINLNQHYTNRAASMGVGKYFFILGNDVEIRTQDWDAILEEAIENFLVDKPDRICYVYIDDDVHKPDEYGGCCYPLVTKEAIDTVGFYLPAECTTWGSDHWLWMIYLEISENRMLQCRNVSVLNHGYKGNGIGNRDNVNFEVENRVSYGNIHITYRNYVNKINEAIQNVKRG